MNEQQNVLDKTMSLHVIKDKMQLKFAEKHADFIANNLETLIDNTYCVAPVRKAGHPYPLDRKDRHNLTSSVKPLEKHWEEAIFRKWKIRKGKKGGVGLNRGVPFRKVVSYQVMLRETNKNCGWGELDLFGATKENVPVAIELKIYPKEYLLRAIVEVLAYGVAIRKAWSGIDGCPLRPQWADVVGKIDSLVDLPLAVVAPASYWQVILSDSPKNTQFQTPQPARQSIKKLLEKMHRVNYPLTFVEVHAEPQPDKSGLPVIINAVVRDLPIPTGLRSASCIVPPKKASQCSSINLDADPDNSDWIRIVRAERIAGQVPGGPQILKTAVEKAGGSRSGALEVIYRLLREAGIQETD
ncbi:MAG: hypothetical protein HW377_2674 [Actinobacteria bacterium]|nr:hypothetical protein [Actinomycetota bacterium]